MKKGVVIGVSVAAVIVVVGGGGFAYAAQLFSSPKQILVKAVNQSVGKQTSLQNAKVSFQLGVDGLSMQSVPSGLAPVIGQFSKASLSGNVNIMPAAEKGETSLTLKAANGQSYTVKAWVSGDKAILNASGLQPLLNQYGQAEGAPSSQIPQIPAYLTTDASTSGQIANLWNQLAKEESSTNPAQQKAAQDLITMVLNGLPGNYVSRPQLNTIAITFSQADLQTIGDAEISYMMQHKAEWVKDLNALETQSPPATVNDVFGGITAAQAEQNLSQALASDPVSLGKTTLEVSKSLFGGTANASFSTSVSLIPALTNGLSGTFSLKENSVSSQNDSIDVPQTNSSNSKTFTDFFSQP